jgi:hypothetical protein
MDTNALNATGIALNILGATLIYVFAIRPAPATPGASSETRETLGLLGYLALLDGFFLQLIASLETTRLRDLAL